MATTGVSLSAVDLAAPQLAIEVERLLEDPHAPRRAQEVLDHDLLVLERLVVLEEPPDLAQRVRGQLRVVGVVDERRIVDADGDDLVVDALLVAHPHHADRARASTTVSGWTGSWPSTSASSGSPSSQ